MYKSLKFPMTMQTKAKKIYNFMVRESNAKYNFSIIWIKHECCIDTVYKCRSDNECKSQMTVPSFTILEMDDALYNVGVTV